MYIKFEIAIKNAYDIKIQNLECKLSNVILLSVTTSKTSFVLFDYVQLHTKMVTIIIFFKDYKSNQNRQCYHKINCINQKLK